MNDEVITQNDLNERVSLVVRQLQREGGALPPADVLARQILERMINDLLQTQLAKENGIKIDDPTLDSTIERIAQENKMSMPDFRAALERDGIQFARFREDIRNEILVSRLREREVESGHRRDRRRGRDRARAGSPRGEHRLGVPPLPHARVGAAPGHRGADRGSGAGARSRRSRSCAAAPTSRRWRPSIPTRPMR